MFDGKFIVTLIALIISIVAICRFDNNTTDLYIKEDFLGNLPSMQAKPTAVVKNRATGQFFSVPGTFQGALNPRFSNTQYGANILYNLPSNKNMAAPINPLGYGDMAQENYVQKLAPQNRENYVASCGKGGIGSANQYRSAPVMQADYADGNYNQLLYNDVLEGLQPLSDQFAIGNMEMIGMDGNTEQPIVYDRLMFANRNSRLRSQGDFIRGDLPIVPCNTGWFQVAANPVLDLQQGAMFVLGGIDNSPTQQLAAMFNDSNGSTTMAGINMSSQQLSSIGAGMNDITVTAFP
jgi:hypothetical protein